MSAKRMTVYNGKRRGGKGKGKAGRAHRRPAINPGELSLLFNGKRGGSMSAKKKGKGKGKGHRHHRPNTGKRHYYGKGRGRGRRHRPNPMGGGREGWGGMAEFVISGGVVGVLTDTIVDKWLTQWASGGMGIGLVLLVGGALSWIGGKFTGNKKVLFGGLSGAGTLAAIRIAHNFASTAPGAAAADVRDATAAAAQMKAGGQPNMQGLGRRLRGMGTIIPFPFNVPQTYQVVNGQLVPVVAAGGGPPANGGGNGMSGMGRAGIPPTRRLERRTRY